MKMIACIAFLLLLPGGLSTGHAQTVVVTVENPGALHRTHETVAVSLDQVARLLGKKAAAGFAVTEQGTTTLLVVQKTEKEILFQSDFAPRQRRTFTLTASTAAAPEPASVVDGRFVPPREDYAWENDRIAFRMYGPALAAEVNNGIDVWTKRVPYPIVAKWYKESENAPPGKDTYHQDKGEGADFFEVGRSLGAGGTGLWLDGKVVQPGVFATYKSICQGPIRVSFELTYNTWNVNGKSLVEHKRISLDAGQYLNKIEVTFENLDAGETMPLAAGLVKRENTTLTTNAMRCWMGLWGLTNSDSVNGSLGTGVVMPSGAFDRFTEDAKQYIALGNLTSVRPFVYYAGAGWTRNSDFKSGKDWAAYLDAWAQRVGAPLKVRCSLKK